MPRNIWDDALTNTLQKPGRIDRYLKDDPNSINKVGGQASLTPLAAACYNGHLEVVTLLLEKGARSNALCPHGRTALYYTLTQAPRNQLLIVKALLTASDGAADPNEVYPEDGNINAVSLAIDESQDKEIVQALVDSGAKPGPIPENKKQAKARKMQRTLFPWSKVVQTLIDLAVSVAFLIIVYIVRGVLNASERVLRKLHKITSVQQNNPVAADIPEPKSPQEFKQNITNFVKHSNLDKFFTKKPDFLQEVAEKASVLRNDTTTDLSKPENLKRLTSLSLYQLVIYCDDSGSMAFQDTNGNRYHNLRQLVSRITSVATKLLPDDAIVKVRFINNSFNSDVTASSVDAVIANVSPGGGTALEARLVEKILRPLVYEKISNPSCELEQPLLVCTITDGIPDTGDIAIKQVVADCRKALVDKEYDPTSVMFCISQIGTVSGAKNFLDNLRKETEIKDVVYCTADQLDAKFAEFKQNERELEVWLLEMLTKPIMRNSSGSL